MMVDEYVRPEFIDVPEHILKTLVGMDKQQQLETLAAVGVVPNGHRIELGSYRGVDNCGIYEVNVSVELEGKLRFNGDYISR